VLLTYQELTLLLRVPVATIQSWVHRRSIPFIRLGRRTVRFDSDVVEAWMRARSTGPRPVGDGSQAGAVLSKAAATADKAVAFRDRRAEKKAAS